ncbi:hypothetical protein FBY14_104184 [Azospirillum brasilense]|nr:hypothetical protein FBY14_104184 [Azospirillum brasilense]
MACDCNRIHNVVPQLKFSPYTSKNLEVRGNMDRTYNLNGGFKPTTKRFADLDGPDFYPTPRWATFALIDNEKFKGDIWECACGDGAMSQVLSETGERIISSDLYNRGFGEIGHDFLSTERSSPNIITNPPFNSAEGFVATALRQAQGKFALLLRLAFLEGANRSRTIFHKHPPSRVWVFSERITFYPKGMKVTGSGTTAYAWFVWDKDHAGPTELAWFKPGYKQRYA